MWAKVKPPPYIIKIRNSPELSLSAKTALKTERAELLSNKQMLETPETLRDFISNVMLT